MTIKAFSSFAEDAGKFSYFQTEDVWHSWHDLPELAAQLAEALAKEKDNEQ